MLRKLSLGLAILISLFIAPTYSNEISLAVQKIEEELQNIKDAMHGTYIGCYKDTIPRVMNGYESIDRQPMTPNTCIARCKDRNFKFAGVQYSYACFCGNTLNATLLPDSECNMACSGDTSKICGAGMKSSVYLVQ